jgi:hypothetical protein
MLSILDNVIANRSNLINNIALDPILTYYLETNHWTAEVFRFVCDNVLTNTNELYRLNTDLNENVRTLLLVVECSRIVIDELIESLYNDESHPIINALIVTGQTHLLKYIFPVPVDIDAFAAYAA